MMNTRIETIRVIIFGATGMVGKAVLIECLESRKVEKIFVVGRNPCGIKNPKIEELLHNDFNDFSGLTGKFKDYDACFYCVGISSLGVSEPEYTKVTHDYTISAAEAIIGESPEITFCFVSAVGADSTEKGRIMWARVKGKTENKLLNMPFKKVFIFRPGYIQPMKGVKSRVKAYRAMYAITSLFFPLLKLVFSSHVTTSVNIGQAIIKSAIYGYEKRILENRDINKLAIFEA